MDTLWYRRLAPVLDASILVLFVAIGRDRHNLDSTGLSWYLTVLWPMAAAWVVGALVTKLYTRADRPWVRLIATIAVAVLVNAILRSVFTDRPWFTIFSVVAFVFLSLTTFGWRLVWRGVARWRGAVPAQ